MRVTRQAVTYVPLAMLREQLDGLADYPCPEGYTLRAYVPGDERLWASIEVEAGEFATHGEALQRFEEDFGLARGNLRDRCFLLQTAAGEHIGTATAWYGHFAGQERGRVSWVGIIPSYQGKGLAKPLVGAVLARLAREHSSAYLTTQTTSYPAVNLYLAFGFVPHLLPEQNDEGWRLMEHVLGRAILSRYKEEN